MAPMTGDGGAADLGAAAVGFAPADRGAHDVSTLAEEILGAVAEFGVSSWRDEFAALMQAIEGAGDESAGVEPTSHRRQSGEGSDDGAGPSPSSAAAVASASTTARVIRRHGTRRPACSRCPAYRWQRISRPSRGGTGSPVDSSTRGAAPGRARCSMA